jgi:hypothetical protein
VCESHDAIGGRREPRVVADCEYGTAVVAAGTEKRDDRGSAVFVEASRRLVGEDKRRFVGEGARDGDALAFTARELRRSDVRLRTESEPSEQRGRAFTATAPAEPGSEHDHFDVLFRVEMREQVVKLEDEADLLAPIAIEPVDVGEIATMNADSSGRRMVKGRDEVQRRRLAATGRPDQHDELTWRDLKRGVVEDDTAATAVRLDDIDELEGEVTHVAAPRAV